MPEPPALATRTSSMTQSTKRTAIIVLGMHRSGTSALSGLLHILGTALPKTLMPPVPEQNPYGFFESTEIAALNDRILDHFGTCWSDITANGETFNTPEAHKFIPIMRKAILEEFPGDGPIVFKDPRTCRMTQLWCEALSSGGFDPVIVHLHRHPLETAQSLRVRDGLSVAHGLLLWLDHVLKSEAQSRDYKRVFVSYPAMLTNWQHEIGRISKQLEVPLSAHSPEQENAVNHFLTRSLRHFTADPEMNRETLPFGDWILPVFDLLQEWSTDAGTGQGTGVLAQAQQFLTDLAPLSVHLNRAAHEDRVQTMASRDALQANDLRSLQNQLSHCSELRQRAQSEANRLRATLASQSAQLSATEIQIAELRNSSSWRATAPLRKIFRLLRRQT